MTGTTLFDLPHVAANDADVVIVPIPFEGTVSYRAGTSDGPTAILEATTQVELWDEETNFELQGLGFHTAAPILPHIDEAPERFLDRVKTGVGSLFAAGGTNSQRGPLVVGIGGEHSVTPPLVCAAAGGDDLTGVTVVQLDAHADLRETYDGSPYSHACAMRRVVELGAKVVAIGIRSTDREEYEFSQTSNAVETFFAQDLAEDASVDTRLIQHLKSLTGDVYVTVDIDALEVHLCPGTGTPQPGGLGWWQALRYLRAVMLNHPQANLIGVDIVETAPMKGTVVNEMVAARLLAKLCCYRFSNAQD